MQQDSETILIIDDELGLRQSVLAYLEDSGFAVLEAVDGATGLQMVVAEKPDLVITDLQLPGISGLDILSQLTQDYPNLPVIVISGVGDMNDVIKALRLGAWDYLTKPIHDLAVLEHTVCKALERTRLVKQNTLYANKLKSNLEMLEEDQKAGLSVQMNLLPRNSLEITGYSFSHRIIPSLYLSGDFVDYFAISDDAYGVYLADVSGHGASSAFITVLLKSLIDKCINNYQAHGDDKIIKPNILMQEISKEIYKAKLGKYLTMIYGVVDLRQNTFNYSIGGHYPNPILIYPDKRAEYLKGRGFPLGILKNVTFDEFCIDIPKNGRLAMFSDGIMEVFMPGEDLESKYTGLLEVAINSDGKTNGLLEIAGIDVNARQPDDIAVLMMQRKG